MRTSATDHGLGAAKRSTLVRLAIVLTSCLLPILSERLDGVSGALAIGPPPLGLLITVNAIGDQSSLSSAQCDVSAAAGLQCTLRAAIEVSNAAGGSNTINFDFAPADVNPVTGEAVIQLLASLPNVTTSLEILGPGAALLTVKGREAASVSFRIIRVVQFVAVTFDGITFDGALLDTPNDGAFLLNEGVVTIKNSVLSNHKGNSSGGAIFNAGTLTITDSLLATNRAASGGGGIDNDGILTIVDSTFQGNSAGSSAGGAIQNRATRTLDVTGTTFEANAVAAGHGGAIINLGTATVTQSLFTGNIAGANGGAIENQATLTVVNSTFFDNHTASATIQGLFTRASATTILSQSTFTGHSKFALGNEAGGSTIVKSCLIAGNNPNGGNTGDVDGAFVSQGFNLVGATLFENGFNTAGDVPGGLGFPLDPGVDPAGLADNGGPTRTIALACGSLAIDNGTAAGPTATLTTDQRGAGFARTFDDPTIPNGNNVNGDGTDIGAFERQEACATATPTPTPTGPTPQATASPTALPTFATADAFMLYGAKVTKGTGAFFARGPVTLADAFAGSDYVVDKPATLALPATVGAVSPHDSVTHLLEHRIKVAKGAAKFAPRADVHVANACLDVHLAVKKPVSLLVPTAKDLVAPPTAPIEASHQRDHFTCYQAKATTKLAKGIQVDVADQFQTRRYDLKSIAKLCIPTAKSGSPIYAKGPDKGLPAPLTPSTIRHGADLLVCYQAALAKATIAQNACGPIDAKIKTPIVPKQPKHAPHVGIYVANQLAGLRIDSTKESQLCVPVVVVP